MNRIAVIDYGMGNLHSVMKALEKKKIPAVLTDRKMDIKKAAGIILPGVGAFPDAMREIRKRGLYALIKKEAEAGKPVMGVCLGHQLLFSSSTEFAYTKGFGLIKGRVVRFKTGLKVPHMGWNTVRIVKPKSRLLKGVKDGAYFYFVHSYYGEPDKKAVLTKTKYGNIIFTSAVETGNVFGVQFHPEKSGEAALGIYKNFWEVCRTRAGKKSKPR